MNYQARNQLWQSNHLQESIGDARVLIAGMGGLGWQIGSSLVGLGVKHITLFDPDELDVVNLNRLWGCGTHQLGHPKIDIFSDLATQVSNDIQLLRFSEKIPSENFENQLGQSDVVFGCFDKPEPRLATQILALRTNTLYIDTGVALQKTTAGLNGSGQVFISRDQDSACLLCVGLKQNSIGYLDEHNKPIPSSGMLNAILGNLAVSSWIKYLQGEPLADLTYFNMNDTEIKLFWDIPKKEECPVCSYSVLN